MYRGRGEKIHFSIHMNARNIFNSFLVASIFILSSIPSCIKQDTPIDDKDFEYIETKVGKYTQPVTMTDLMFVQGDTEAAERAGVSIDSLYINLKGTEWRDCEPMGEGVWWVRDICKGEDLRERGEIHLHNFTIKIVGHGYCSGDKYKYIQKITFFPVTPGAYNEYIFNITADYKINIYVNPGFSDDINKESPDQK